MIHGSGTYKQGLLNEERECFMNNSKILDSKDITEAVSKSIYDLNTLNDDINGLNDLVSTFFISVVESNYSEVNPGTPEYTTMIYNVLSHILKSLRSFADKIDNVSQYLDKADIRFNLVSKDTNVTND